MHNFKKGLMALAASAVLLSPVALSTASAEAAPAPATVAVMGTAHDCFAYPIKQNGPGLKNWRAVDPWCNGGGTPGKGPWYGPWRYTKSGALIDAETHNQFVL